MKTKRTMNYVKLVLTLAMLGILSMPQSAFAAPLQIPTGPKSYGADPPDAALNPTPDYYTTANWANSPPLNKFVDTLPGLGYANRNNLGQYIPVAVADKNTYPGSDYYIIELREWKEKMHSELQPTTIRGYVQVKADGSLAAPDNREHYLGPAIIAQRDRPVRLLFRNKLPAGAGGDLFIPVDTTVMGAGPGPAYTNGNPCPNDTTISYNNPNPNGCASYTQNRATVHLHGGRTPWISDGTPHQWIVPAAEFINTPFKQGASMQNVPDMPAPGPGEMTYYYTNQQSARLMFYHDHAMGITRLNVYAGEAAAYVITDDYEKDLVDRGLIPDDNHTIPLVLQDKTYVDATLTDKYIYNPDTGLFDKKITVPKVRETDPLWNWGSNEATVDVYGVKTPVTGDLWLPHVYMPAQSSIAGSGGVNPFGRWMYGPWFYPATVIDVGPQTNPYYDPNCSSANPFLLAECQTPGQPEQIPGTPNVSMGMEAFQDSAVVNGTAFPTLTVDPTAYRFRILNAASDRFFNLNIFKADADPLRLSTATALTAGADARGYLRSNKTEVKMADAAPAIALASGWPAGWPTDGREGGVPDPGPNGANLGPKFLQIASEGGFLPKPVLINHQPITYILDPTAFWVGNVDKMGLAVGPAERADVIVDFSAYRGQTLILYNDAPAAWPAGVPVYDYYTDAPDRRDTGGYGTDGKWNQETGAWEDGKGSQVGKAPNVRTVMQIIVRDNVIPIPFNSAPLEADFTSATVHPSGKTLFERSQDPIIVGQAAYASAYPKSYFPTNFPWEGINQMNDQFLQFVTLAGEKVKVTTEPKGLHDEMGASFDPVYGRMSGNLAMQLPNPTTLTANLILYGFSDLPTENVENSTTVNVQVLPNPDGTKPGTLADGTQIWKISHNGVDTHPIHFHIFDVQLINRVGWDGQMLLPEPNELGWKDTVKISPLEDTIVAVRPRAPALPFGIPRSLRPLNPSIPIDSTMGFNSIDWVTGNAWPKAVTNVMTDFGWEYVWHCHILSHEEMDMMRPIVLNYVAALPPAFTATADANGISWNDPTPFRGASDPHTIVPANPEDYRSTSAESEIGYNVYRTTNGSFPTDLHGNIKPLNYDDINNVRIPIPANSTKYADAGANTTAATETYVVEAFNAKGSTFALVGVNNGATLAATVAAAGGPLFASPASIPLEATVTGLLASTVTKVDFYDGTTLIGTDTSSPTYTITYSTSVSGSHSVTAKVYMAGGRVVVSAPITVTVTSGLVADFTATNVTSPGNPIAKCDTVTFDSATSTRPTIPVTVGSSSTANYSWQINGRNYTPTNTATATTVLIPGINTVTLGIINTTVDTITNPSTVNVLTDQITKSFSVTGTNTPPTVTSTGGPYTVDAGQTLILNGSGTDADVCDDAALTYSWDLDGKNGYEYNAVHANPAAISYNALKTVLGAGIHTITFKVTDSSGESATASTTVQIGALLSPLVPTTLSSSGTATPATQTYSWGASANATSYTLYNNFDNTYTSITSLAAGCSAGTGTCTVNETKAIPAGTLVGIVVNAINSSGTSPWSTASYYTVFGGGIPAIPTSLTSSGTATPATQTYSWSASANATSYTLYNNFDNTYTSITPLTAGCSAGTGNCTVSETKAISAGTYIGVLVRAINNAGSSPWSTESNYTIQ